MPARWDCSAGPRPPYNLSFRGLLPSDVLGLGQGSPNSRLPDASTNPPARPPRAAACPPCRQPLQGEDRCCGHSASTGSKRSARGDFKFSSSSPAPAPSPLPGPLRPQPQGQAEPCALAQCPHGPWRKPAAPSEEQGHRPGPSPALPPAPGLRSVAGQVAVGVTRTLTAPHHRVGRKAEEKLGVGNCRDLWEKHCHSHTGSGF